MRRTTAILKMFWDSVIVIEEDAYFFDQIEIGGSMSWGEMFRGKMKDDVEFNTKMRRIRRKWYWFQEEFKDNLAGIICVFFALAISVGAWVLFIKLLEVFQ